MSIRKIVLATFLFFLSIQVSLFCLNKLCFSQDILVNDKTNELAGISKREYNSVAMDRQGNFVVVWADNRNTHFDIWAQRFDNQNNPVGENIKVNDDQGTDNQTCCRIAMDEDGDYMVVWHDNREGKYNIYGQKFDAAGCRIGPNFKIANNDDENARQLNPSISMDKNGNFVVAWIDGRDGGQDIYAQRFDDKATPIGDNIHINENNSAITGRGRVNVSLSEFGTFCVTWSTHEGDYLSKLYAKFLYFTTGLPLDSTCVVASGRIYIPHVGMDEAGIATIIWEDYNTHPAYVAARRYDESGNPLGNKYSIDDSSWDAFPSGGPSPSIAVRSTGEFVVSFGKSSKGKRYACVRRFNSSGLPIGASFLVDEQMSERGTIAVNSEGQFAVVYTDHETKDLYVRTFDWSEEPCSNKILLPDDENFLSQNTPKIAMSDPNNFMIMWTDARTKGEDSCVFGKIFHLEDNEAVPHGENFLIPGDGSPWKYHLASSTDIDGSNGRFVVVFTERHFGELSESWTQTAIRVLDETGGLIASNRHYTIWDPVDPSVAVAPAGNFVVAKREYDEGYESDIFLTFFDRNAQAIQDIRVNASDDNGANQIHPLVALNDNIAVVAWNESREGNDEVWARIYSIPQCIIHKYPIWAPPPSWPPFPPIIQPSIWPWPFPPIIEFPFGTTSYLDSVPLTDEFKVHDLAQKGHYITGVAIDNSNSFIIAWNDRRDGDWDVYARRFNNDYTPNGAEFKVNDDGLFGVEQKGGDIHILSPENGDFAITWYDWRNGDPDIYIRIYDGDGSPKGGSFRINSLNNSEQLMPAISGTEKSIITTWLDNRNGDWDVYLKATKNINHMAMSISPENILISSNEEANFQIILENGAEQDSYSLEVNGLPDIFSCELETSPIQLQPWESVSLNLRIITPDEAIISEVANYPFTLTAASVNDPNIFSTAEAVLTLQLFKYYRDYD